MKLILGLAICFVFASLAAGQGYGRRREFRRRRIHNIGPIIQTRPAFHPKPFTQLKPVIQQKPHIQTKPIIQPKPLIQTKPIIHPKPAIHPKPVIQPKPVVHPKPIHHQPVHHPIAPLSGGGMGGGIPADVLAVIGSTITGRAITGGMEGFPQHGGTLNAEGLMNGWGEDPSVQANSAVTGWHDPWEGRGYPVNYQGQNTEDLIFDPVNNRYVLKHQQAKDAQFLSVTNGGLIHGDTSGHVEHKIVKDANLMANQAIQGISPVGPFVNTAGQHVESKLIGQQMHNNAKAQDHSIIKSSGVIRAGRPSHLSRKHTGTINTGLIGHTPPEVIAQNIGIATLGADAMRGHAIAQSFGPPQGVGFINPSGPMAAQLGVNQMVHNTAKASSFGVIGKHDQHIGLSQIGLARPGFVGHDVGGVGFVTNKKAVSPIAQHIGGIGIQTNPVDAVHNVIKSGVVTARQDSLSANIGSHIANHVIEEVANAVEMGSNGGLSNGDPIAIAATHDLAQNTGHIVGKILNVASQSSPIQQNGPIAVGKGIFGHGPTQPIFHKPAVKKPQIKALSGYGRRRF